ncbi:unnamed protein product, partial [Ectocarpus sp. 13 AM-2016]
CDVKYKPTLCECRDRRRQSAFHACYRMIRGNPCVSTCVLGQRRLRKMVRESGGNRESQATISGKNGLSIHQHRRDNDNIDNRNSATIMDAATKEQPLLTVGMEHL